MSESAIPYEHLGGDFHRHGGELIHAHPHSGPHTHELKYSHEHGHSHGLIDPSIKRSRAGPRTVGSRSRFWA